MTALVRDINVPQFGTPDIVVPALLQFPVAAATTIYGGAIVATNAAGNAVPATSNTALRIWGRCEQQVINAGAAGAQMVLVRQGAFPYNNGTAADALTAADAGNICYVIDDNTVGKTDGGGTRQAAGLFYGLDYITGNPNVGIGFPSLYSLNSNAVASGGVAATAQSLTARNAVTSNVADLAVFTVAGNDGVTNVAGDTVLLINQTTPAQNGLYIVGTVGGGTAPLTRSPAAATGDTVAVGALGIAVQAGTLFAQSEWKNTAAGVINTATMAYQPSIVTQQVTLVSGTVTVTNVPVLSATKTAFISSRVTPTGTALTINYNVVSVTPGALGTATFALQAQVAAGTINVADGSVMNVTVLNF